MEEDRFWLPTNPLTALSDKEALFELNMILNKMREPKTDYSMVMMEQTPLFGFATAAGENLKGWTSSLESMHGDYHVIVGGPGGHMSKVPVAAFDPVFWFHHV